MFSGIWAGILVDSYNRLGAGELAGAGDFAQWVERCRAEWAKWERETASRELPWFTREKLERGSFATLLGVRIEADVWRAVAWGDSCLFLVRNDALLESFPIHRSADFDSTPSLVSTLGAVDEALLSTCSGTIQKGDRFYLASDALACWFLSDLEAGAEPWVALDGISHPEELECFVGEERSHKRMKNDDVTLIAIRIED